MIQQTNVIMPSSVRKSVPPIFIIGALFFVFGFITWLNAVLIPYLRIACELNNFQSYLVAFSFYVAYLVMAIPSAWILSRTGFKKGMSVGLLIMAVGAVIFIPAAISRTYFLFLAGLFVQGTGMAVLQTASNPYITIIGPKESAAKRISIMGICNKVAGAIAPIILGAITLSNADEITTSLTGMNEAAKSVILDDLANRVILPYVIIVAVLLLLSVIVKRSSLPEVDTNKEEATLTQTNKGKTSIWYFPNLLLGVLALFLYVGVEVIAGDTIISYASSQGFQFEKAKFFTTFTLLAMIAGYLIGIAAIPKYLKQEKALMICAVSGVLFSIAALTTTGFASVLFVAALGLSNSLMWPAIWPLAISGLGRFTRIGSSLLIMGISGGAVLPLLYGFLADRWDGQSAYIIMIPCYLFIAYYATWGHKLKNG
jgi:glucose/galactose transporter